MYCSDKSEYSAHVSIQQLPLCLLRFLGLFLRDCLCLQVAGAPFQSAVEPILLQAQVDVMMTGHEHGYERIHPAANGSVVSRPSPGGNSTTATHVYRKPAAPLGLMAGSAGGLQSDSWVNPQPDWSAFRVSATLARPFDGYGYIMMVIACKSC